MRAWACALAVFWVVLLCPGASAAQGEELPDTASGAPAFRRTASRVLIAGLLTGSLVDSYFAWWKGSSKPFTFHAENWVGKPFLGIDKAGHLYTSYFQFRTFRSILLWGEAPPDDAFWWGAALAGLFALSVEVGDGLGEMGFDYQDLLFNMAGLGYGMLQVGHPFLENFAVKWSYIPQEGFTFPPRFTEHYDAHTYWLAVKVNNLLPQAAEGLWPDFLNLAVGYGVGDGLSRREWVVGLDFNLDCVPAPGADLLLLRRILELFRYPAPGVEFSSGKRPEYRLFHLN
ncbi:MAG: DUF2279 domain-containing protein [Bacteroidota bacterium]